MQKTDYSKIAKQYDSNPLRRNIPKDEEIQRALEQHPKGIVLLDLACGTGNYLASQMQHYHDAPIQWLGLDLSDEMLDRARSKGLKVEWIQASVDNMPLQDKSVDFIKLRFAHHHFPRKEAAFKEIHRILKPGGRLSIFNICHEYSRKTWVYRFFPWAEQVDKERFPSVEELHRVLRGIGFTVNSNVAVSWRETPFHELITEAKNRDMSQLHLISQEQYQQGMENMRQYATEKEYFLGDVALLSIEANKI